MASLLNHLPLAFLLFLTVVVSSTPIQATESRFSFSKAVRYEVPSETTTVPTYMPAMATEEPAKLPPQSQHGYGLYGRDPNQFLPTATPNNGLTTENSEEHRNFYNNNNYDARYRAGNVPTMSPKGRRYGMSDNTRFVDKGEYFYNVKGERVADRNGYDPTGENSEGSYGEYNGEGVRGGGGGYGYGGFRYGSKGNGYKYNNGMEGYQYNQERQEEFVP